MNRWSPYLLKHPENHCCFCVQDTRHAEVVRFSCAVPRGTPSSAVSVEYGVVGNRLNIRHDKDMEYSCQIEGTEEPAPAREPAQPAGSSSGSISPAATAGTLTADLSITLIPEGADMEVDGNFSGNTPSDLKVPEGEHLITIKITGYRNWDAR